MPQKPEEPESRHRKKPSHKGKQCKRGVGLIYNEKKVKLNLTITPKAIDILDAKAKSENCSISTLVEEFARSPKLVNFHINQLSNPSKHE